MPGLHKLYLDQMLPRDAANELRSKGYDVLRASEVGQSRADDDQILRKAITENRVLVTLDEHFGDWVVLPLSMHPGVIRLKANPTTSGNIINLLIPFLQAHDSALFQNRLIILSEKRVKWINTAIA